MKKAYLACFVLLFLMCPVLMAQGRSQERSTRIQKLTDDIARAVERKKPGWKHTTVTPIEGSEGVVIDQWSSGRQTVRVTIVTYANSEEASAAMRRMVAAGERIHERLLDLGDEGYVWGTHPSIVFRRGDLLIYISSITYDPNLDNNLNREFANLVAIGLHLRDE